MDDNKHGDKFNASLPLPDDNQKPKTSGGAAGSDQAADLIRKKVEAAYGHEPDAKEESEDIEQLGEQLHPSKHQEFIYNLTNSGQPLHEIQTAWHEYYAGLPDDEKHQVWQEFYTVHAQASQHPAVTHTETVAPKPAKRHTPAHRAKAAAKHKLADVQQKAASKPKAKKPASNQHLHSLLFGLGVGSVVILIFLFSFFNERIIAPFIQPSRNVANIPIISDGTAGGNPEVIIPKINVEIPVVYDINTIEDSAVQKGLERGVVHYADTATPGQNGNVVIVGHSSNNIFNQGKYKFAFVLLSRVDIGDTFYLQKDGKRYTYQVYDKKIVKPSDVSVLGLADKPATATLITCDPPGTSTNRLVVTAQQISPDPVTNTAVATTQSQVA
ncbi:sortase, partial [Candidatus Saccharibacteria bacterium]|nr:sortase [Candidatus Saccharibacteria bacterium]